MNSNRVLWAYELRRIASTTSSHIVLGLGVALAVASPLTAWFMPGIIHNLASGLPVAEPVWQDSYAQWEKNLHQIISIAIIIVAAHGISGGLSGGDALLVLSRNVSRRAYVSSKIFSYYALSMVVLALGTLVVWGVTNLIFGEAALFEGSSGEWLMQMTLVLAVITGAAVIWQRMVAAAGAGCAIFLLAQLASFWESAPPVWVNVPLACVILWAAIRLYDHIEIGEG
ncbi:ABC transporter permease [Corynebacterium pseudotuberculosis]|nr:ABC transporter permease [Corynebacterium pseudotuberculosis]ALR34433.1 membrane protein [Corynebacterium pseudotuberculosis]ATQ82105.1 ABC transporter permease [Corynebacterium pseudotuberculosis]